MKKVISILLLSAFLQGATAQEQTREVWFPKHEIDIGVGIGDYDDDYGYWDEEQFWDYHSPRLPIERYNRAKYTDFTLHYLVSYNASYRYGLSKHWYVGAVAGYHYRHKYRRLRPTGEIRDNQNRNSMLLMPSLRYYLTLKNRARLYWDVAVGASFDWVKEPGDKEYRHKMKAGWQATLLGYSGYLSPHTNFFTELGVGELGFFRCGITIKLDKQFRHTYSEKYVNVDGKSSVPKGYNPRTGRKMRLF